MKIEIKNFKCPSWNEKQRTNWALRIAEKNDLIILACDAVRKTLKGEIRRIAVQLEKPVILKIEAHFKDYRRRDPDNLYVKPIIDGIVKSGLLSDDNGEVIDWVCLKTKVKMPSDQIIIFINE